MGFGKKIFLSGTAFTLIFSLLACAGSAGPGGASGGPIGDVATSAGGSHAVGGGNGGDGGSGGAVPPTQEAAPGLGAPCGIGVPVRVRVIENGYVRYCDGRQGPRADLADLTPANTGSVAKAMQYGDVATTTSAEIYEEPWTYNPKISFDFIPMGTFGEEHTLVDATCESDGNWTSWQTFRWGYKGPQQCADFRFTAKSTMRVDGEYFSSPPYQNNSIPVDSQGNPLPILLIIDRGTTE